MRDDLLAIGGTIHPPLSRRSVWRKVWRWLAALAPISFCNRRK
jgi:hypothetical protein